LTALKMSNSLTGGKCRKSLYNRPEWGPAGVALF
jgi:hypothetical protein